MGILDRQVKLLNQKTLPNKIPVSIRTAQTPDDFYKDPNAVTWFYSGGFLTTGKGNQSHHSLNFDDHFRQPSGRVSSDKSTCAVWASSVREIYLTEWFNAFSALYNKGIVNDNTVITSGGFRETPTVSEVLKAHYSNEESDEKENFFSVYSVRLAEFEKRVSDFTSPDVLKENGNCTTFFFIDGKMYYASGSTPHFDIIRKQVPPKVFKANQENYASGRYTNDGKVVAIWDLLSKSDPTLNHQAVQELVNSSKIAQDAVIYNHPFDKPIPVAQYMGGLVTAQFEVDPNAGNEDYFGGWEEKEQVSTEVRHYFNNGSESLRNTLHRAEAVQHELEGISRAFKGDKFINTVLTTVQSCVNDLKELNQIFYDGASGILSLKNAIKTAQQKRQVSIHPLAFKARSKIGLLAYDLHELGKELLFEYNGSKASDTNMSDDARAFQWESAYAIGIINNYIKDINDLYRNLSWLDYQANTKMYDFFSNEDTL